MKVIVSVQAKSSSSRGLVHYIAHSKIETKRESDGREIFNACSDEMSVEKANQFLNTEITRKRPPNEELHHLVISLKSGDFENLGNTENERQKSLKEIACVTMKKLEVEIGASSLNWVAGIHRNTENPHIHIAIQKTYFDRNLDANILTKIPQKLLPHYEKNEMSEKTLAEGLLIETATEKLNAILEEKKQFRRGKTQENNKPDPKLQSEIENERNILGRSLLAKYHLERSEGNLDSLINHGNLRRFKIFDPVSGKKRLLSLFDLERRAETNAAAKIKRQNISDPVKQGELRKKFIAEEMLEVAGGIKRIKTILHKLIVKENQNLRARHEDYQTIKPLAEKIRADYRQKNKKIPTPNLTREELEMLQAEALQKKDFRVANYFERVRLELSCEQKIPTRTDEQIQILKAEQTLTELKFSSQEKELADFQRKKLFFRVEIDGKIITLGEIEESIRKHTLTEQKLTSKISKIFGQTPSNEKQDESKTLGETRRKIVEILDKKEASFDNEIKRERSLLKTLSDFYQKDTNPNKDTLAAKFGAKELAEIESLSIVLNLPEIYRENWFRQKEFIENAQYKNKAAPQAGHELIGGRVSAQRILNEIEVQRRREDLQKFAKNKKHVKFEIKTENGIKKFVSLSQVGLRSRSSFHQTIEYFTENRQLRNVRHQVEHLIQERQSTLTDNLRSAKAMAKITEEEARLFQTRSFLGAAMFLQKPLFTPKELVTIELRINQTPNKLEADYLQKILASVDHSQVKNLSAILQRFDSEKESAKPVEHHHLNEQLSSIDRDKEKQKLETKDKKLQQVQLDHQMNR